MISTHRYYVVPGSTMSPMLINPDRDAFVIVESELNALMLDQIAGDLTGILAVGSAAAKPDAEAFKRLKAARCILNSLDFDKAGAGSWTRWLSPGASS